MRDAPEFDWDEQNERHLANHGISRSDAEDVLSGNHVLLEYQMEGKRTTLDCRRCESHRSHIEHSVCSPGRSGSSSHGVGCGQGDSTRVSRRVGKGINMAKAKMKAAMIPKFSSEAEEAAWWDAHRSEIEAEIRQRMRQKRPATLGSLLQGEKPSQPVTLRIATKDLEKARRLAARKGVGYQTYIKMLLRDALAIEIN